MTVLLDNEQAHTRHGLVTTTFDDKKHRSGKCNKGVVEDSTKTRHDSSQLHVAGCHRHEVMHRHRYETLTTHTLTPTHLPHLQYTLPLYSTLHPHVYWRVATTSTKLLYSSCRRVPGISCCLSLLASCCNQAGRCTMLGTLTTSPSTPSGGCPKPCSWMPR